MLLLAAAVWWRQPGTRDAVLPPVQPDEIHTPSAVAHQPAAALALPAFLPDEARTTLALIARDGPFPHRQDGSVFGNREGHLPQKPRGYYREYTVETPGLNHRGARRIVTGGQPPQRYYYTDDHYDSFRSFTVSP
jgi:guanyl-specific ribonuclease Sa